jgi:membrane-associated protease RseP (regulator of RpoE activity)
MSFALGVVLFALVLAISIAAHEFGHLLTAKMFGMKARRYFIGFGPKIWSFRRGETEYGLKAIPAGGFVDIAGMSHVEELHEDDEPRAFWRYAAWKRIVVMSAGSATHFALALVILYGLAITAGLPNAAAAEKPPPAKLAAMPDCVQRIDTAGNYQDCAPGDPVSPAKQAGLREGDLITKADNTVIGDWDDLFDYIRKHPNADVTLTYQRDTASGPVTNTATVHVLKATRPATPQESSDPKKTLEVGVIGIQVDTTIAPINYNPISAVGGTLGYTGSLFKATFSALGQFPSKIPKLIDALSGKPRDTDTPVSVIGASKLGGQAVEAGQWQAFFMLLAAFNLFIGVFNLVPLLPLDGGHVAVLLYEKIRNSIARARGKEAPGSVDQAKLAPIMLTVIFVVGSISLLTMYVDVANPITNPFK